MHSETQTTRDLLPFALPSFGFKYISKEIQTEERQPKAKKSRISKNVEDLVTPATTPMITSVDISTAAASPEDGKKRKRSSKKAVNIPVTNPATSKPAHGGDSSVEDTISPSEVMRPSLVKKKSAFFDARSSDSEVEEPWAASSLVTRLKEAAGSQEEIHAAPYDSALEASDAKRESTGGMRISGPILSVEFAEDSIPSSLTSDEMLSVVQNAMPSKALKEALRLCEFDNKSGKYILLSRNIKQFKDLELSTLPLNIKGQPAKLLLLEDESRKQAIKLLKKQIKNQDTSQSTA